MSEREPVGVIGVGWVGLVTAACFAEIGHPVVARDIVGERVEALSRGETPFHEPGLDELLARNRERLTFTTDIGELLDSCRLLFVCVDTPPTYSGDADLSRVRAVIRELEPGSGHVLVMKSTVPAGTGASIRRDLPGLAYVSCPEFLKEGSAVEDFLHPDRVVIGAEPADRDAAEAVERLYAPLGGEMVHTDVSSAEMIKLASNAFLATKISFINEIANVCEEVGADVSEVARGMGLDERIGASFLRAGIGYGGSCFEGGETVLARISGTPRLATFAELWEVYGGDEAAIAGEAIEPHDLWVWSWVPGEERAEWMPVSVLTKRNYSGELVEVNTKMGRRARVTADHPFLVGDGDGDDFITRKLASELTDQDWLPIAGGDLETCVPAVYSTMGAIEDAVAMSDVIVRPEAREIHALREMNRRSRSLVLDHPRGHVQRLSDITRSGALRFDEACRAEMNLIGASFGTARNGTYVPERFDIDERFWRVVGLYLAEGCVVRDRGRGGAERSRIRWSFHPSEEEHLVEEVARFWERHGVRSRVFSTATTRCVEVSSRILAAWWTEILSLGCNSYEQRLPDMIWEQSAERKRALLSGLWEGDGSWSLVNGGPSVVIEFGTVSDALADGAARLLGHLGVVCSWRRSMGTKSTKETHWLRVSGADQVQRALFLVPEKDRGRVESTIECQAKRIRPTGYRRFPNSDMSWVRITRTASSQHRGPVYSLKVPGAHTVITSGGLVAGQCFPKDVNALKMLAGNTGYHFQLLTAVIEVNELQKRRVIGKLQKHLGDLAGKRIALLGLAFKPNTDDMREASSLVLASRLQGEGAVVSAYDPVAAGAAAGLLESVEMSPSALAALEGADAAILVTEWPEFAEIDWTEAAARMANPLLIDGRNYLDPAVLAAAGFTYEGIGRVGGAGTSPAASTGGDPAAASS